MILRQLFDKATSTYTYLLGDAASGEAVIIDPVVDNADRDLALAAELGLRVKYSLETHIHADHIAASGALRQRAGAQTVVSVNAGVTCADIGVDTGDTLRFGPHTIEVRLTPGHTSGDVSFIVRDNGVVYAFTGDTLFVRGCGRTDFQQGDSRTMYRSVHAQLYTLPDDAIVYPGHDYKGHTASTIGEEKRLNPRLNLDIDEDAFVEIMGSLNLAHPRFIDQALPANLKCGQPAS